MRDELSDISGTFIPEQSDADPVRRAQIQMKRPLPKRFYESVGMEEREEGFSITLDGKSVKTPAKNLLTLPTREAAELVVAEWAGQGETIDPAALVLRDMADHALDVIASDRAAVIADLLRYAETDTLCYRADPDEPLHARQIELWEPPLKAAEARWVAASEALEADALRVVLARWTNAANRAKVAVS